MSSKTPPDQDSTSLGQILVAMGACTSLQVTCAAEEQRKASEDRRIGMFLVAHGVVSREQLEAALEAQTGLRSKKRHLRALAQADIAEKSGDCLTRFALMVRHKSSEVKRKTTGSGHPAITAAMLAKSEGD